MSKEAMKLALEALELEEAQTAYPNRWLTNAITALREALAEQPAQKRPQNRTQQSHQPMEQSRGINYANHTT